MEGNLREGQLRTKQAHPQAHEWTLKCSDGCSQDK